MSKSSPPSKLVAAIRETVALVPEIRALDLTATFSSRLALRVRRAEADRAILHIADWAAAAWRDADMTLVLTDSSPLAVSALQDRLATTLGELAARPFTPRLVTEALNISNQERLRWTKDGRLSTSGRAQIKGAAVVTFATYAVSVIETLAADRTVIEGWRAEDREAQREDPMARP